VIADAEFSAPCMPGSPLVNAFDAWLQVPGARRVRGRQPPLAAGGLRFTFYGRLSTARFQDPASSQASPTEWRQSTESGPRRDLGQRTDVVERW
jgi:hypothetical protein